LRQFHTRRHLSNLESIPRFLIKITIKICRTFVKFSSKVISKINLHTFTPLVLNVLLRMQSTKQHNCWWWTEVIVWNTIKYIKSNNLQNFLSRGYFFPLHITYDHWILKIFNILTWIRIRWNCTVRLTIIDQRSLWNLERISKSRLSDALDAWKYFWLHTPFSI
jgi:hypothetical protein